MADWAARVAVDSAGDVAAIGQLWPDFGPGEPPMGIRIVKLEGSAGTEIWRNSIAVTGQYSFYSAKAVRFDSNDDVLVVGDTEQICSSFDFSVVHLDGTDGSGADNDLHPANCMLSAKRLKLNDKNPNKQKLLLKSKHLGSRSIPWNSKIPLATQGSVDADPTIYGATLEILNPDTSETASIDLPAEHWSAEIRVPAIGFRESFEYEDKEGEAGPCTSVRFFPQKRTPLKLKCKGALGLSLDEASQGRMAVRLVLGGPVKARYCMEFGDDVLRDRAGTFVARDAAAPESCDFP